MTRFMLLTGAAALAIGSAATATAQGKGPQGKGERPAKAERAQKQAKSGNARGEIRVARASERRQDVRVRQDSGAKARAKVERRDDRRLARVVRNDRLDGVEIRSDKRGDRRLTRLDSRWDDNDRRGGVWANGGCPPGLASKPVPCIPPGQVKHLAGQPLSALRQKVNFQELPVSLRSLYRDDDDYYYRYGNGYVYRIDRDKDVISSLLPLFGLGATVGQPFPSAYANSYVPTSLRPFYPDSPYASYRYANGYVYKVNPLTGLVQAINPMLGYGQGYGQMMPATYSAYNVPYQYRSLYQDNANHYYRYAPGSIYRVDAGSGLIDSVAALLMPGGLSVGQPMPMGYDAYNVPYQYRSQYYDTPQTMYRYSNGSIYQIDPVTRLVTAIISALI